VKPPLIGRPYLSDLSSTGMEEMGSLPRCSCVAARCNAQSTLRASSQRGFASRTHMSYPCRSTAMLLGMSMLESLFLTNGG